MEPGEEAQGRAAGPRLRPAPSWGASGSSQVSLDPDASLSSASAALPARGTCDTLHSVRFSNMSVIHEEAAWVWTGGHDADSCWLPSL